MAVFSVRADRRCQRGLHFVYALEAPPDLARLEGALRAAFDDRLVGSVERWGARSISRLVLQFRFEVRLGTGDLELSFLHRATADAIARAADRKRFESVLTEHA